MTPGGHGHVKKEFQDSRNTRQQEQQEEAVSGLLTDLADQDSVVGAKLDPWCRIRRTRRIRIEPVWEPVPGWRGRVAMPPIHGLSTVPPADHDGCTPRRRQLPHQRRGKP